MLPFFSLSTCSITIKNEEMSFVYANDAFSVYSKIPRTQLLGREAVESEIAPAELVWHIEEAALDSKDVSTGYSCAREGAPSYFIVSSVLEYGGNLCLLTVYYDYLSFDATRQQGDVFDKIILDQDLQTRRIVASVEAKHFFNIDDETCHDMKDWLFANVHPDDLKRMQEVHARMRKGEKTTTTSIVRIMSGGAWRFFELKMSIILRDQDYIPLRGCGILTDVTEQLKAKENHQLYEHFSKLILEDSETIFYLCDIDGVVLYHNRSVFFKKECEGLHISEAFSEEVSDIILADIEKICEEKLPLKHYYTAFFNGFERELAVNRYPVFDENREVKQICTIAVDVGAKASRLDERRDYEYAIRSLKTERELFAYAIFDDDAAVLKSNKRFKNLFFGCEMDASEHKQCENLQFVRDVVANSLQSGGEYGVLRGCESCRGESAVRYASFLMKSGDENLVLLVAGEAEASRAINKKIKHHYGMIGESREMHFIYDMIRKVSAVEIPVLILGESGTGKELVARAIHDTSLRRKSNFVAVNCAALPEQLIESELFGHVPGAFTGATKRRVGRVELAKNGTLFLDEIGELSLPLQAKLLRFLEEGTYEVVGESMTRKSDVRIVAATNANLREMVAKGDFREDLYYRLNVVSISLPALKNRGDDVLLIAERYLELISGQKGLPLSDSAIRMVRAYPWPGNVRELRNAMEYATVMGEGGLVMPEHLPAEVNAYFEESEEIPSESGSKEQSFLEMYKMYKGDRDAICNALGISRSTFFRRLSRLRKEGQVPE